MAIMFLQKLKLKYQQLYGSEISKLHMHVLYKYAHSADGFGKRL
jgi:hypothetical protein